MDFNRFNRFIRSGMIHHGYPNFTFHSETRSSESVLFREMVYEVRSCIWAVIPRFVCTEGHWLLEWSWSCIDLSVGL